MVKTEGPRVNEGLCSVFSRANGEDPGGTAPSWERCLMLELARPWDSDVQQTGHFPSPVGEVLAKVEGQGGPVKLQCLAPDPEYSVDGHTRLLLFSRPAGPFVSFDREDYLVPNELVGAMAEALLVRRDLLQDFSGYRQEASGGRDLFVCTHGRHDTCCGTFGFPIYDALRNGYAVDTAARIRVWQISHVGGHRYAPNIVDMPQGLNWVRIGLDELEALVHRDRPPSELKGHYRGRLGLDSLYEQLAERELLVREGWDWTARPMSGQVLELSNDGTRAEVRIETSGSDGRPPEAYEATVVQTGAVPRVGCPGGEASGEATQFTVSRLVKAE